MSSHFLCDEVLCILDLCIEMDHCVINGMPCTATYWTLPLDLLPCTYLSYIFIFIFHIAIYSSVPCYLYTRTTYINCPMLHHEL